MGLRVQFCGEEYIPSPEAPFYVGREGDLVIDDNPYLHRHFLMVNSHDDMWWLENVGTHLSATVADGSGLVQAYLAPGGRLPVAFARTEVWFTAGPTTYDLTVLMDRQAFVPVTERVVGEGDSTIGRVDFSPGQRLLLIALAEPILRQGGRAGTALPSSSAAAQRLGWPLTTFNRKLDHLCERLSEGGVPGLHATDGRRAVHRRARLVEYAIAARLVGPADLALLPEVSR